MSPTYAVLTAFFLFWCGLMGAIAGIGKREGPYIETGRRWHGAEDEARLSIIKCQLSWDAGKLGPCRIVLTPGVEHQMGWDR